ncbi:FAD-dependent oxidoreductase [Gordonia sp. SID5947]|uniref:NAD(P)/FAD-dependent oxidoreductase n=1 Tax=Gordonia sp. SID5947 TaxID=2690315 RepID=UPI00136996E7|nr:NAD(P)/FAD-dependent oxidoreductase [Gordonia sp. SID5947]MYR05582.1 FAD-dependent oxidoreductase [Gordonia sp. SID5947]
MVETVDVVVVGAGVIGLAVARELASAGREVLVLESENAVGTQTSSRNSEVIHAGIYYPTGSRKAIACVAGRELLYRYCVERAVPHRRLGKVIVATDRDQIARLDAVAAHAAANGVTDLEKLDEAALHELEPHIAGVAGLLSPSTGIVDGHALMRALRADAEGAGAGVALGSRVVAGSVRTGSPMTLEVAGVGDLRCRGLVNCGGLGAWDVAGSLDGFPPGRLPARWLAKGNYYTLSAGSVPFRRLVYPVPVDGGLGVHLTLDMGGAARFGPDVEWTDELDYRVDPDRADRFYTAIRRYWPELPDDALTPAYAGIRPKLSGPGEPSADFFVQGPAEHGVPGLINMFGIESPGLTSCLALARDVRTTLGTDTLG